MLIPLCSSFHGGPAREKAVAFQICPTGHCRQALRQPDGNAFFTRTTPLFRRPPNTCRVPSGFHFLHPYCLTKKVRILSIFVFKYLFFIIKSSKNDALSRQKIVGTAWKWKYIAERCLISSFCAKSSLNPAYFVGETKKPADSFKIAVRRF